MAKLIAVGLDGSDSSWKAFKDAVTLAQAYRATLHVVSIQEPVKPSLSALEILAAEKTARENLELVHSEAKAFAGSVGLSIITAICEGDSVHAMVDYVKKARADLLVVGDTGHSSIWGALLGSTAERIV
ncbi:MAG: universal stress protein, partial [Candidatus Melainabacteria bacterium]|nr:universal stress protein [Candidatus Melainabacteria bacterium]